MILLAGVLVGIGRVAVVGTTSNVMREREREREREKHG